MRDELIEQLPDLVAHLCDLLGHFDVSRGDREQARAWPGRAGSHVLVRRQEELVLEAIV